MLPEYKILLVPRLSAFDNQFVLQCTTKTTEPAILLDFVGLEVRKLTHSK